MSTSQSEEFQAGLQHARQRDIEELTRDLITSLTAIADRVEGYATRTAHVDVPFEVTPLKGVGHGNTG